MGASIYEVRTEGGVKKYPKFADKQCIFGGQRGEGVKKCHNLVDVTY